MSNPMTRVDTARWLADHRERLASLAIASAGSHDDPALGLPDAALHLSHLEQAVAAGQQPLFTDYVAWAKVLGAHTGATPGPRLKSTLQAMRRAVHSEAPDTIAAGVLPMLDHVLDTFEALPTDTTTLIRPDHPQAGLARRYLDHLLAADRRAASTLILGAVDDGVSIRDIYLGVFQPVQYEIGRLWQINQVTVAQEHYCTAATQLVMSQLYPKLFTGEQNGLKLVVACVSGDLHEIGARVVTDIFEADGWDTFYVGANTPTDSVVSTVCAEEPDLLALSATMTEHVPRVREVLAAVRAVRPQLPIMVGGYPFIRAPDLWRELGADGTAGDADHALQVARQLVGG